MILTAGLTPAWQQILVFDQFRQGEVNRAREAHWCASGKVLNAGIAVHGMGGPSLTLAPVGGPPVAAMDRELDELGVPRRWIITRAATRVCTTILDRAAGTITELVENGRPLGPDELIAFRTAYAEAAAQAAVALLTGSLPAVTPVSFYRELVERTPCPALLDFRGEGLLSVLDLKPFVVKPNREELSQTLGHPLNDDRALIEAMRELNRRGARWAVVTQGPGPVWLTSTDRVYRLRPPPVGEVVNAIGSGDAMAAAICWAIRDGREMPAAVQLGIAAAFENLRQLLPCRLDPARVEALAEQVEVAERDR